jgi:hypothetical protein
MFEAFNIYFIWVLGVRHDHLGYMLKLSLQYIISENPSRGVGLGE